MDLLGWESLREAAQAEAPSYLPREPLQPLAR